MGSIPGSGRSPGGGHGNPLQYPCLKNPMDRGAWWAMVHGATKNSDRTEATQHKHKLKEIGRALSALKGACGTSLVVRWLSLHTSNAEGADLVPGQGTKFPHAMQHSQKVKNFKNEKRSTCLKHNKRLKKLYFFFFFLSNLGGLVQLLTHH